MIHISMDYLRERTRDKWWEHGPMSYRVVFALKSPPCYLFLLLTFFSDCDIHRNISSSQLISVYIRNVTGEELLSELGSYSLEKTPCSRLIGQKNEISSFRARTEANEKKINKRDDRECRFIFSSCLCLLMFNNDRKVKARVRFS
jgi:hypothetical protein